MQEGITGGVGCLASSSGRKIVAWHIVMDGVTGCDLCFGKLENLLHLQKVVILVSSRSPIIVHMYKSTWKESSKDEISKQVNK